MYEVGELVRVAYKEDRSVVSNKIPVAFFRVKLQRESPHVPFGVRSAGLSRYGREAGKPGCLFARRKYFRLCIARDVPCDFESTVSAPALGVHGTLRNAFAILVREFLNKLVVLKQHRSSRPCSHRILVI